MKRLLGVAAAGVLAACSPVSILNGLAPRDGVTVTRDLHYAAGDRHGLDIYAPAAAKAAPVVVFVYGGGWTKGDKGQYRFVGSELAAKGFLTVIPDYRVYPQVRYPDFLRDNAAAVAWTRANIARYGGDPSRLFLMGHSAGAYNVAMLTLDKRWLAEAGLDPDRTIAGTIGLSGPYDFLPIRDPDVIPVFASAADMRETQPIAYARGDAPPMLLATGTDDRTVLPRNTEHLAAAIALDGGHVETRFYEDVDHVRIVGAMSAIARWLAPTMTDVLAFLEKHS
jgi:acetyl esterase/lipase